MHHNRFKMAATSVLQLNKGCLLNAICKRFIHKTSPVNAVVAGKYKRTKHCTRPLTYEQSYIPSDIAHKKAWNSWNTVTLEGGFRISETVIDDIFIRKFLQGTFHSMILSEIIIKRQHNIIRISFIVLKKIFPMKYAFLIGYTEEMLGYWLQCPVKLELNFTIDSKSTVFKYI